MVMVEMHQNMQAHYDTKKMVNKGENSVLFLPFLCKLYFIVAEFFK